MLKPGAVRLYAVAAIAAAIALLPAAASAQQSIDPTAVVTPNDGGWIGLLNLAFVGLAVLLCALLLFGYLRLAPRFRRAAQEEATVLRPGVRAPELQLGAVAARPPAPAPAAASVAAPVAGPAAAAASAPAPAAPAPASAAPAPTPTAAPTAPAPTAEAAAAAPAAPAAEAAAPETAAAPPAAEAPAAAPAEKKEAELDQETFERVLAEQLDKGVDRRVAEGRARAAAIKAGRAKAGG